MPAIDWFSPDYRTARRRFLEAAERSGLECESHTIDAPGPDDGPLAIDVAIAGPPSAGQTVLVTSGLHGAEGFFGSAVQLAWLDRLERGGLPEDVRVVLAHALNPYGFAWRRRWNENNIDLNRNFLGDRSFLDGPEYRESVAVYERLDRFLNPTGPPRWWDAFLPRAARSVFAEGWAALRRLTPGERPRAWPWTLQRLGRAELRKTLPVGQYRHPHGLFYGGDGPEQTTRIVRRHVPEWVGGAGLVVHLDLHTGLGRWGEYALLIPDPAESPRAQWVRQRFPNRDVLALDGKSIYDAQGAMCDMLGELLPQGCRYFCVTAEFGTYGPARVLQSLRAENRAHHYARPGSKVWRRTKQRLVEAFAPADPAWRRRVVGAGVALIDHAVQVCIDEAAAGEPVAAGGRR